MPDLPEEAVEAAVMTQERQSVKSPTVRLEMRAILEAAAPAIEEKARKQERERYREGVYQKLSGLGYMPDHLLIHYLDNVDAALAREDSDV